MVTYLCANTGYSNPTIELLKEAERYFGRDSEVATIISVGAGKSESNASHENPQMIDILKRLAVDTERVHNEVQNRLKELAIYFRFNVDQGISTQATPYLIRIHTQAYLEEEAASQTMDDAIKSLLSRRAVTRLREISTSALHIRTESLMAFRILDSVSVATVKHKPRPSVVPYFVGRQDILQKLCTYHLGGPLEPPITTSPRISILTGLGGSGKTQISLRLAAEYEKL
jgi:hypothetical protein